MSGIWSNLCCWTLAIYIRLVKLNYYPKESTLEGVNYPTKHVTQAEQQRTESPTTLNRLRLWIAYDSESPTTLNRLRLRSLLLCLCDVFRASVKSLVLISLLLFQFSFSFSFLNYPTVNVVERWRRRRLFHFSDSAAFHTHWMIITCVEFRLAMPACM